MRWPLPRSASACEPPSGVMLCRVMFARVKSDASLPNIARLLPALKLLLFAYWITVRSRSSPRTVTNGCVAPR